MTEQLPSLDLSLLDDMPTVAGSSGHKPGILLLY